LTPEAQLLLREQRGVIATWQLASVGMSAKQVRAARGSGWQAITPRTLLAARTQPTSDQFRVAGVLEAGPDAALTGCSALIETGWSGRDSGAVDVTVARGHRSRRVPGPSWLRVHSSVDVPRRGGTPPRVPTQRAVVDAATWARTPRERMFIMVTSVQQRLVTPAAIRGELARRGRLNHSRDMVAILDDVEHGVTSTSEADFLRECRARGLPTPRMQVARTAGGRRRRIDAEFRLPDGRVVLVEIDGLAHLHPGQWHADLRRQNELAVADPGAIFLHISSWQVRYEPDPFFDVLTRAVTGNAVNGM
jgi:hypothetical protein